MCRVALTIPSLVWLRRALRRWRSRAAEAASSSPDAAVPAGHVAVSVQGPAAAAAPRRFVVRLAHLSHPAFLELLRQAEEEYGFPAAPGPVALPCDEDRFLDVLRRVTSSASFSSHSCGPVVADRRARGDARPLLRGMAVERNLVW
jgi:SAUR family protein